MTRRAPGPAADDAGRERRPLDPAASEATLASLRGRAREQGLKPASVEALFEKFISACRRYASLEKLALGEVPLQFPAHLLLGDLEAGGDALAQGVRLAALERERLNLGHGAVEDVESLIERQGLKIIELPIPADLRIIGAFVFDENLGPAILVSSRRPRREREYAITHEYGHFLADHDPYQTWICLRGRGLDSAEEMRAHAFAGAFLVPGPDIESYLRAASVRKGDSITADLLRQLRTYFEADDRAILAGLLATGWLSRGEIGPLLEDLAHDPVAEQDRPGATLSARIIGLAVMARREGRLSLKGMARHLDVSEATARRIERSFGAEPGEEEEEDADSPD